MDGIKITEGRPEDLPQVLELIHELAEHTGFADQVANTVERMLEDGFGDNPIYGLFVAKDGDKVLGAAIYYYRYSTWKGKRLYLEDFVVRHSIRGKGIGKLLFEATLEKSLTENCSGMMWQVVRTNDRAIDFYKKYEVKFDYDFINCGLEKVQIKEILSI